MPPQLTCRPRLRETLWQHLVQRTSLVALLVGGVTPGCTLLGVEPDEIDLANGTESSGLGTDTDTDSSDSNNESNTSGPSESGTGDGDGDPTGETDTDPTDTGMTTDPTGDATGDGDGDPASTTDTDSATDTDTDSDTDSGPPEDECGEHVFGELVDGPNPVDIPEGPGALEGECGAPGPELVYTYTASADGELVVTPSDFDGEISISLLGPVCSFVDLLDCALAPESAAAQLVLGETIYIVVDSADGAASGTVTLSIN